MCSFILSPATSEVDDTCTRQAVKRRRGQVREPAPSPAETRSSPALLMPSPDRLSPELVKTPGFRQLVFPITVCSQISSVTATGVADSGLPMTSPELCSLLENLTGPNETGWTPLMSIRGLLSYLVLDLSATSSDVFLLVSNAVCATSVENHRQNTEIIQIITQIS